MSPPSDGAAGARRGRADSLFASSGARWALGIALTVALALLTATQLYVNWRSHGAPSPFLRIFAGELVEWASWAAFLPVIVLADRRAGFGRGYVLALPVHAGLAVGFFAFQNAVMIVIGNFSEGGAALDRAGFAALYAERFVLKLPSGLLVYGILLTSVLVLRLYRAYHRRSLESERLAAQLQRARFENLSAQMHPHFLFNSLHTIAGLVREGDRELAIDTIATLGGLLRRSLEMADEQEVPLEEELALLDGYVRIQRARFGDRLSVERDIDPELLDERVPTLFLQPLVENAIRHGLELEHGTGRVRIRGAREDGRLVFEVSDNGCGFDPSRGGGGPGVGLRNTRERLEQLYGPGAGVEVRTGRGAGTTVRVSIPDAVSR